MMLNAILSFYQSSFENQRFANIIESKRRYDLSFFDLDNLFSFKLDDLSRILTEWLIIILLRLKYVFYCVQKMYYKSQDNFLSIFGIAPSRLDSFLSRHRKDIQAVWQQLRDLLIEESAYERNPAHGLIKFLEKIFDGDGCFPHSFEESHQAMQLLLVCLINNEEEVVSKNIVLPALKKIVDISVLRRLTELDAKNVIHFVKMHHDNFTNKKFAHLYLLWCLSSRSPEEYELRKKQSSFESMLYSLEEFLQKDADNSQHALQKNLIDFFDRYQPQEFQEQMVPYSYQPIAFLTVAPVSQKLNNYLKKGVFISAAKNTQ